MTLPRLSIVVACSENHVIGVNGDLPWRLSSDLARFKKLTMGHAMIMGRKTYESIGKPLPGRVSVVLTRDKHWSPGRKEVRVHNTLESALHVPDMPGGISSDEVFVVGGGEIYRLALPYVERVYLTRVHATIEGDTTFPELATDHWTLTDSEELKADERNDYAHTFEVWNRSKE